MAQHQMVSGQNKNTNIVVNFQFTPPKVVSKTLNPKPYNQINVVGHTTGPIKGHKCHEYV